MYKVVVYCSDSGRSEVAEYLAQLSVKDRAQCDAAIQQLANYGFMLPPRRLKKLSGITKIWELRISTQVEHRLLITQLRGTFFILSAFTKKTQKTPRREIATALNRKASL